MINHTTIPMEMMRVLTSLNQLKDTNILIYRLSTNQLLPATSVESYMGHYADKCSEHHSQSDKQSPDSTSSSS